MKTYCVRNGQIEVGVIEHEGREFLALGATVVGRNITGYTKVVTGDITLATWCGQTMLASRCEVVERYWSGSLALLFRLSHGRFIVGYSLAMSVVVKDYDVEGVEPDSLTQDENGDDYIESIWAPEK